MQIHYCLLPLLAFTGLSCEYIQAINQTPIVQGQPASDTPSSEPDDADPCYLDTACQLGLSIPNDLLRAAVTVTMNDATTAGISGVLLNSVGDDESPYVLTARHTRSGRHDDLDESLGWLEFHVGHRNQRCGVDRALLPCRQDACCIRGGTVVATGADRGGWQATGSRDFRLIRLARPIPSSCGATYAGWSLDTTGVSGGIVVGYPEGRPLAAAISDGPMRGLTEGSSEGMLFAPITRGRLAMGQSGSPLATRDGKVLGVVRTGTPCPPRSGTGTSAATLVHNWLHGPPGNRLIDHLAGGNGNLRSLPARN